MHGLYIPPRAGVPTRRPFLLATSMAGRRRCDVVLWGLARSLLAAGIWASTSPFPVTSSAGKCWHRDAGAISARILWPSARGVGRLQTWSARLTYSDPDPVARASELRRGTCILPRAPRSQRSYACLWQKERQRLLGCLRRVLTLGGWCPTRLIAGLTVLWSVKGGPRCPVSTARAAAIIAWARNEGWGTKRMRDG